MTLSSKSLLADPITHFPQATVAAFDPTQGELPRRRLDVQATQAFITRLAEHGTPGVLVGASTGQGHLRQVAELAEWFDCVAQVDWGDMVGMALLRPEDGLEANQQLLDQLTSLGYPIVFFRPGTNLPADVTTQQMVEHLAPFVNAAATKGLAIGLYSIPDVSGVRLTPDAVAALLDAPGGDHLVAVKVTEADYDQSTLQFLQHPQLTNLKIVQGWDPHLMRALQDGRLDDPSGRQRCGVTSGPMSFALFQYLEILRQADLGNWDEVARLQHAVTTLFQSMQDDPNRFADLQRAKYIMGLGHPLTQEVTEEQVARVFAALASLPRAVDRLRLAASLDLMGSGPFHQRLNETAGQVSDPAG